MTNSTQPTPGVRPELNPNDNRPQQPALTPKPLVITPPAAPQTTGVKPAASEDKSGEMESAGGGAKTVVAPVDPSRTSPAGAAPTANAPAAPAEPAKDSGERGGTSKDSSSSNASTKQQGC